MLDVNLRTLQKRLAQGMPAPAKGEQRAAWAVRANRWLEESRQPVGRRPTPATPAREERERLEVAILQEKLTKMQLENKWQSGDLISRSEREEEEAAAYGSACESLLELPRRMVRQLCLRRESEAILAAAVREILAELSAAFQDLHPDVDDDEPDTQAPETSLDALRAAWGRPHAGAAPPPDPEANPETAEASEAVAGANAIIEPQQDQ